MGQLCERMGQDLVLRNFSPETRRIYLLYRRPIRRSLHAPADAGLNESWWSAR
jgi:hypothetical protein